MRKKSFIWKSSDKEFQKLLNESNSFVDILKKLGFSPYSGNHRTLKKRIKEAIEMHARNYVLV